MDAAAVRGILRRDAARAVVVVDFDGSLAPIVEDPHGAVALPGTTDALARLVEGLGLVAVISGRPASFLADRLPVPGLVLVGQYGLERVIDGAVVVDPRVDPWRAAIGRVADEAEAAWPDLNVERKEGLAVTLHWRGHADAGDAAAAWAEAAAARHDLQVVPGRLARELRPGLPIDKGAALDALLAEHGSTAALFAGDDHGDLAAFDALDRRTASGELTAAIKVGVSSDEGPPEIRARADLVVDGPPGLLALLEQLATEPGD